jgi:mannitol-specific phosphotransferase system IIBC component
VSVLDQYMPTKHGSGLKGQIQRMGGFLAGMVMPNIAAFIAWGLITALFIPTGWLPKLHILVHGSAHISALVSPMIVVLLPLLIGTTGGRLIYGQRGAVVGAIATTGVIVGAGVVHGLLIGPASATNPPADNVFYPGSASPQFLAAMIVGPSSALLIKHFDKYTRDRIPSGFEMLVENFSAGILGAAFCILGFLVIGPVFKQLTTWAGDGVHDLVKASLIPLASIIVEPAKVLFLNNAINHGVLEPLGLAQSAKSHQSLLFMIETDPGPGLGLLLAYWVAGPKRLRPSVPGAIIIQFFGGIHEIYFPYVLMKPRLLIGMILGGGSAVLFWDLTGAGLVAGPSPGSIFAYLAETPPGGVVLVPLGIIIATAVSFFVNTLLLKTSGEEVEDTVEAAEEAKLEPTSPVPVGA